MKASRPTTTTTSASEPVRVEIQVWMARRRMNQSDVAEAMGVAPSWVNKRLHGAVALSVDDLMRIAAVLDVPIGELFRTPEPYTELRPTRYTVSRTGTPRPDSVRPSRIAA